jgi:hypothetical protein
MENKRRHVRFQNIDKKEKRIYLFFLNFPSRITGSRERRRRDEWLLNGWRVDNDLTKWMAVLIQGTDFFWWSPFFCRSFNSSFIVGSRWNNFGNGCCNDPHIINTLTTWRLYKKLRRRDEETNKLNINRGPSPTAFLHFMDHLLLILTESSSSAYIDRERGFFQRETAYFIDKPPELRKKMFLL